MITEGDLLQPLQVSTMLTFDFETFVPWNQVIEYCTISRRFDLNLPTFQENTEDLIDPHRKIETCHTCMLSKKQVITVNNGLLVKGY